MIALYTNAFKQILPKELIFSPIGDIENIAESLARKVEDLIQTLGPSIRGQHLILDETNLNIFLSPAKNIVIFPKQTHKTGSYKSMHIGIWVDRNNQKFFDVAILISKHQTPEQIYFNHREKELLQRFKGQNVVPELKETFEMLFQQNESRYIFIENLYQKNLLDAKDQIRTSNEFPLIILGILQIIKIFHKQGFAIRDIKLENFLLANESRKPIMCDLGFVWRFNSLEDASKTQVAQRAYTPQYISPESCKRMISEQKTSNAPSSDIWSLGIVMAELLRHQKILTLLHPPAMMRKKNPRELFEYLAKLPPLFPEITDESPLVQLAAKCLNPNPETRPTAEQVLEDPLFRKALLSSPAKSLVSSPAFLAFIEDGKMSLDETYRTLLGKSLSQIYLESFQKKLDLSSEFLLKESLCSKIKVCRKTPLFLHFLLRSSPPT